MWQIAGSRLATSLLERVRAGVAHFEQLPLFRRGSNLPPRWMGGTLARPPEVNNPGQQVLF